MYITKTYKYKKNGIIFVGGVIPQDCELLETMNILNSEKNYELLRKSDNKKVGCSIWLKNGDSQENYLEIDKPEERTKRRLKNAE